MSKRKRKKNVATAAPAAKTRATILLSDSAAYDMLCLDGYTTLSKNPEIVTAVRRIAELISSMTIYLMANTASGDERITNELSRKIDINPNMYMTRKTFIDSLVMNLLLHGNGNAVVKVHTKQGLIDDLEPIQPYRVSFIPDGYGYHTLIDGRRFEANDIIHCVWVPDEHHPWMGAGLRLQLKDIVKNLTQARKTENAFMTSKYKPPLVVKVDAMADEFASPSGREKLIKQYLETSEEGQPWIIPADLLEVKEVRPLSLSDIALNDTVKIDKQAVAALLGVPAFLLGVGKYDQREWNSFINNTIRPICRGIEQEFTRKLILSPKWYFKFNTTSLIDWDFEQVAYVFGNLSDRGFITGNEVRDKIGMSPLEGLDKPRILENFIPIDMIGKQKKLIQQKGEDDE